MRIACPICRRVLEDMPEDFPPRPFCSARCRQIDLGNWLTERYKTARPLEPDDLEEADPAVQPEGDVKHWN